MGISTTTPQNDSGVHLSCTDHGENKQEESVTHISGPPGAALHPDIDEATREQWLLFEAWRVGLVNNE